MSPRTSIEEIEKIGVEIARVHAREVDERARFPSETIGALRELRALSATSSANELARACTVLAQHCASSAMIFAMHHIQVWTIAQHAGSSKELADYLRNVAGEQRLIASVTSEVGTSGDLRKSIAAVEKSTIGFELCKKASTLSYARHADDLLITVRKNSSAAANDQVLVLALRGDFALSELGVWDTLGMRGTCSPSATVQATGAPWQILRDPFGEIATYTMTPISHILWASVWLGIATDAVSLARALIRARARQEPGVTPQAARHVSEIVAQLQLMQDQVESVAGEYDALIRARDRERLASLSFALRINNLKLSASRLGVEIVTAALGICGIQGYRNDSPFSLGRHLRDALSASLMINNDRLHETNASLLLVHKGV